MSNDIEREYFEKWMETSVDDYDDIGSETLFECWQAARAQQAGSAKADIDLRIQHADELTLDRCDSGHVFAKLPDHPMRDGRPRCPHCLSKDLDEAHSQQAGSGGAVAEVVSSEDISDPGAFVCKLLSGAMIGKGDKLFTHPGASVPASEAGSLEAARKLFDEMALMADDDLCMHMLARALAAPQPVAGASVPEGYTPVKNSVLRWLLGESGDFVPTPHEQSKPQGPGKFWWRTHLRGGMLTAAPQPVSNETEVKLTALLGVMCGWFETLADIAGWTPENAGSAWAGYRAAKEAMLGCAGLQPVGDDVIKDAARFRWLLDNYSVLAPADMDGPSHAVVKFGDYAYDSNTTRLPKDLIVDAIDGEMGARK